MSEKEPNIYSNNPPSESFEKKETATVELTQTDCDVISYLTREELANLELTVRRNKGMEDKVSKDITKEAKEKIRNLSRIRQELLSAGFPMDMKPSPGHEAIIISPQKGQRRVSEDELKDRMAFSIKNGTAMEGEKTSKQVTIKSIGLEPKSIEVWQNLRELLEKSKGGELMEKYGLMKTARPRVSTLLEGIVEEGHEEQNVSRENIRDEANKMIDNALVGLPL